MDKGLTPTCPDSDAQQSFALIRCPENFPKWYMQSQYLILITTTATEYIDAIKMKGGEFSWLSHKKSEIKHYNILKKYIRGVPNFPAFYITAQDSF